MNTILYYEHILQKRTPTNSTNVNFKNFMNPYKDYTKRLYFCSLPSRI